MSTFSIVAIAAGTLIVWGSVSGAVAVLLGRAIYRADRQQPPPIRPEWPEASPFDLEGYELDARFYGVVAEAWQ
jgi:hypothetical protein